MSGAVIECRDLSRSYHDRARRVDALSQLSLTIPAGALAVVAGPSGSGKSTLLNLIGGLDRPSSGELLVDGEQLKRLDERALALYRRCSVGYVFQSYNLLAALNVRENVELPLRLMGISDRRERVEAALEAVGMVAMGGAFSSALSGGEQQRAAIARALIHRPKLLLADEPTGSLDSESGAAVIDLLSQLNRHTGATVVVASHDPMVIDALPMSITMCDGKIEAQRGFDAIA